MVESTVLYASSVARAASVESLTKSRCADFAASAGAFQVADEGSSRVRRRIGFAIPRSYHGGSDAAPSFWIARSRSRSGTPQFRAGFFEGARWGSADRGAGEE